MYNPVECGTQFKEDIQLLIQMEQYEDVLLFTDRLLAMAVPHVFVAELHRARAQAYGGMSDWASAICEWTRVLKMQPRDSEAYLGRGKVRETIDDVVGATFDYTRAAEISAHDTAPSSSIRMDTGSAMCNRVAVDYAACMKRESASSRGDCPCVKNGKGYNANCRHATCSVCESAEVTCTCAIRLDPSDAQAYLHRAFVRHCRWNQDGSAADCTQAINLDPHLAEAYSLRGRVYEKLGETEKAASDRHRALELSNSRI